MSVQKNQPGKAVLERRQPLGLQALQPSVEGAAGHSHPQERVVRYRRPRVCSVPIKDQADHLRVLAHDAAIDKVFRYFASLQDFGLGNQSAVKGHDKTRHLHSSHSFQSRPGHQKRIPAGVLQAFPARRGERVGSSAYHNFGMGEHPIGSPQPGMASSGALTPSDADGKHERRNTGGGHEDVAEANDNDIFVGGAGEGLNAVPDDPAHAIVYSFDNFRMVAGPPLFHRERSRAVCRPGRRRHFQNFSQRQSSSLQPQLGERKCSPFLYPDRGACKHAVNADRHHSEAQAVQDAFHCFTERLPVPVCAHARSPILSRAGFLPGPSVARGPTTVSVSHSPQQHGEGDGVNAHQPRVPHLFSRQGLMPWTP